MLLIVLRRVLVERQINVSLNVVKISDGEVKSELTSIFSYQIDDCFFSVSVDKRLKSK
jgi:hypothetical protein